MILFLIQINCLFKNMMKISICVPVYGVEKFIERCSRSILEQDYFDLDIIFVDDKSNDLSVSILKKIINDYPSRKEQVRIIRHSENKGLAEARNTAVANAKGDFLIHVDGDDYIDGNFISSLVNEQKKRNFDIVFGSSKIIREGEIFKRVVPYDVSRQDLMINILSLKIPHNVWGVLIKTSLYRDYDIKNIVGINNTEDLQIIPKLIYHAKSFSSINNAFYFYDCSSNGESYTNKPRISSSTQSWITFEELFRFFKNTNPLFLEALNRGLALNIAMQMIRWSQYKEEYNYYDELVSKAKKVNYHTLFRLPIKYSMVLLLKKRFLINFIVLVSKKITHILK